MHRSLMTSTRPGLNYLMAHPSKRSIAHMYGTLTLNQPTTMNSKAEVLKALNQLISLIAGKSSAVSTNHLAEDPAARVSEITNLTAQDLIAATKSGDVKALKQAQRKLESLSSLQIISTTLIEEVDWT